MKIAFLDSGIGGLTVVKKLMQRKSGEFLYYADNDYMPYGSMTKQVLISHLSKVCEDLTKRGAELIVLACNTATAVAIDFLRQKYPETRFVGTEPAIKPARLFGEKTVVLATPLTLAQPRFARLVSDNGCVVFTPDCAGLAYEIEKCYPDLSSACRLVDKILAPFADTGIASIVLGCTHYVYLEDYLAKRYSLKILDGIGGVTASVIRQAPQGSFCDENLLRLISGDESQGARLIQIAKSVCGCEVALI